MKKILFSICALAITALALVSCGNDDDDKASSKEETQKVYTLTYVTAVSEAQPNYFDQSFKFTVNGIETSTKLANMTDVTANAATAYPEYYQNVTDLYKVNFDTDPKEIKFYSYTIGTATGGTISVAPSATVKSGHPTADFTFVKTSGALYSTADSKTTNLTINYATSIVDRIATDENRLASDAQEIADYKLECKF